MRACRRSCSRLIGFLQTVLSINVSEVQRDIFLRKGEIIEESSELNVYYFPITNLRYAILANVISNQNSVYYMYFTIFLSIHIQQNSRAFTLLQNTRKYFFEIGKIKWVCVNNGSKLWRLGPKKYWILFEALQWRIHGSCACKQIRSFWAIYAGMSCILTMSFWEI